MEIDLNKEQASERSEFNNFSIREYVAKIREKDRKKCWPFGSLGDPSKLDEFFALEFRDYFRYRPRNDDTSEHKEVLKSSEVVISNGKECRSEALMIMIPAQEIDDNMGEMNSQTGNENSIEKCAEIRSNVAAADDEPIRNRRKPRRFRLLSDLLKELAGPSGEHYVRCDTNVDNVNSGFANETEDDSDNVPLGTLFRKRKSVEVARDLKKKKKKKRKTIRVEKGKRSKPAFKDSNGNDSGKTRIDDDGTQKDSRGMEANEDSEMEAVMLLARHFNELENPSRTVQAATKPTLVNQSTESDGPRFRNLETPNKNTEKVCACVQKMIRECSNPEGNESIPASFYADTHKKSLLMVQTDGHRKKPANRRSSGLALKGTSGRQDGVLSPSLGLMVCSINRNPADFNAPEAGNEFMRKD